jgi:hypothetical protein
LGWLPHLLNPHPTDVLHAVAERANHAWCRELEWQRPPLTLRYGSRIPPREQLGHKPNNNALLAMS